MNKRKPVDYTELYTLLDGAIDGSDTQMAQYTAIGKAVAMRPEKGAAVAAAEYLQQNRPELTGFSPRNLRRMRAFYQTYGDHPDLLELAMRIGWTLNILILEADLDLAERVWYLNAVLRFGWTKTVLKEKLMETAHLENSILDESDSLWYTKEEKVQDHMPQEGSDRGMKENCYICCDLKSFYASVECIERGLDPMTTNLVVADKRRTEKTICLAVTPSLKAYGISGRARLFEVMQRVGEVNAQRKWKAPGRELTGSSWHDPEVKGNPSLALDYIVAPPRMANYIEWSTRIYQVYLKYAAPEDIHVYSIDEVFIDASSYLGTFKMTGREYARAIILDILKTTGITAAAGIGTNLYLAKIAMDIEAKHVPADEYGVRIAELDEMSYRQKLWSHRPLTDFWRVGKGYATKLESHGLYTMGDIARCSLGKTNEFYNEELLYHLFGVNAELLIDHAWGWEPCTIADVKAYKPENKSVVSGQVLQNPYNFEQARLVVREMADSLALDLVDKGLLTDQLVLTVGYDIENLTDPERRKHYTGPVTTDRYGRKIPKHAHGTANLGQYSSSAQDLMKAVSELYDRILNPALLVRRLSISANHLVDEATAQQRQQPEQLDLFTDYAAQEQQQAEQDAAHAREKKLQETMLGIKKKYGKNAILKGMNLEDRATARERNQQIGGHQQ